MKPFVWLEVLLALLINGNGSIASFSELERGQATLGMTPANEEWRLANGPRKNMTSQWIFDTTASLLQKWPNTRLRNGRIFYLYYPSEMLYLPMIARSHSRSRTDSYRDTSLSWHHQE